MGVSTSIQKDPSIVGPLDRKERGLTLAAFNLTLKPMIRLEKMGSI